MSHTYCDANGTAPDLWNSHKEELHTHLFTNTMKVLEGKRARKDPNELRDSFKNLEVKGVSEGVDPRTLGSSPRPLFFSHWQGGGRSAHRHGRRILHQGKT